MKLEEWKVLKPGDIVELSDDWFVTNRIPIPSVRWTAKIIDNSDGYKVNMVSMNAINYSHSWYFRIGHKFTEYNYNAWRKIGQEKVVHPREHRINLLEV